MTNIEFLVEALINFLRAKGITPEEFLNYINSDILRLRSKEHYDTFQSWVEYIYTKDISRMFYIAFMFGKTKEGYSFWKEVADDWIVYYRQHKYLF